MDQLIEHAPADATPLGILAPHVQPLPADTLRQHAPAAHLVLARDGGLAARCSIWTDATPLLDGQHIGIVGHYAAVDSAAGTMLLDHAVRRLGDRGLAVAVGPMDGNTWRRYRMLTDRGDEPPFFLEPDNPDEWPGHFAAAGFAPLARYFSALNEDRSVTDPRVPATLARLAAEGVVIRPIRLNRFEDELRAIHALSLEAFAGNFLYTPISEADFLTMYAPVRAHLRPELILLAERRGSLLGFVFGLPDLAQAQRGRPIDTAVAKTVAVRPGRAGAGLGSVLIDGFQRAARRLGYRRVIHALMHEGNRSRQMVARFGRPMRQYALYARRTGSEAASR